MSADKRKKYQVILLDVDGTLLDFDRAETEAFGHILEHYGFLPEQELIGEYHQINKECWEAFEEGRMEKKDVLTRRFERFFKLHGRDVDGAQVEELYRGYLEQGAYLLDGALQLCEYLKERYELYIVTNGVAQTQHKRLADSGLTPYFQNVFVSEEAGSQKPNKAFFDYCFASIQAADPGKMLLIGDSLTSDMLGGLNAGIDTCWYNPGSVENVKNIPVTYEVRSLQEIREII